MSDGIKISCKVEGGADIDRRLRAIGGDMGRKVMRTALKGVGAVWTEEVKSRVPVDSGDLRDSINYKVRTRRKGDAVGGTVDVGPTVDSKKRKYYSSSSQSPGVYGLFVESTGSFAW